MKFVIPWLIGLLLSVSRFRWEPFPAEGENPFLDLIAAHDPILYYVIAGWYYLAPWAAAGIGGAFLVSAWQIWFAGGRGAAGGRGSLPRWPTSAKDKTLSLVVGETHHPTEAVESENPGWLTLSEKGLFTGVAVVGAVGTGKTSACMHPFAEQLFSWQSHNEQLKTSGLVLEVKGDFCYQIKELLDKNGRGGDYLEVGLDSRWQWNPLDANWMDSYSLAYTIAGLMNQLFGRGKEPFWQQASTNLVRNIIELYRVTEGWVTLRDVYNCAIDKALLADCIKHAEDRITHPENSKPRIVISRRVFSMHLDSLRQWGFRRDGDKEMSTESTPELGTKLSDLGIDCKTLDPPQQRPLPRLERIAAVKRWYEHDWLKIDPKLSTSIVEGISVFLGLFDMPDVARMFCPDRPPEEKSKEAEATEEEELPASAVIETLQPLPPLESLIESGKVLCLNMPASGNPALARAIGVLLKQSWLQALLRRPSEMRRYPAKNFRPAVFLCDEYQAFATVGEADPCGDEKAFALSRQSRCVPIVATQSISSLRSVTGTGESWRTLLQTLRTKVFLSLSDDASARIASEMCGQVERMKASYSYNESHAKAGVSLFSGAPGGGRSSMGASKSYQARMEPLFRAKAFAELDTAQAVVLPFDGKRNLPAKRVYLKPYFLPRKLGYWRQRDRGLL